MARLLSVPGLLPSTPALAGIGGGFTASGGSAGFLTRPGVIGIIVVVVALAALALYRNRRK